MENMKSMSLINLEIFPLYNPKPRLLLPYCLMQDPGTLKLQTLFIKQGPNSTCNFPFYNNSSKTDKKYLNSDANSNHTPSIWISHSNPSSPSDTITLLLTALTSPPLLLHTYMKCPTIGLKSSFNSLHKPKSFAYKWPGNLQHRKFARKSIRPLDPSRLLD